MRIGKNRRDREFGPGVEYAQPAGCAQFGLRPAHKETGGGVDGPRPVRILVDVQTVIAVRSRSSCIASRVGQRRQRRQILR
jgi:hypothetical protein